MENDDDGRGCGEADPAKKLNEIFFENQHLFEKEMKIWPVSSFHPKKSHHFYDLFS